MSFQPNDPIWAPGPDGTGKVPATFLNAGEPAEAQLDPSLGVRRDIAWIAYEEGELAGDIAKLFYREISAREP